MSDKRLYQVAMTTTVLVVAAHCREAEALARRSLAGEREQSRLCAFA